MFQTHGHVGKQLSKQDGLLVGAGQHWIGRIGMVLLGVVLISVFPEIVTALPKYMAG